MFTQKRHNTQLPQLDDNRKSLERTSSRNYVRTLEAKLASVDRPELGETIQEKDDKV